MTVMVMQSRDDLAFVLCFRLYHYFKGDEKDNNCTKCVGDFMTAAHDIRLAQTGASDEAPPAMIPCENIPSTHVEYLVSMPCDKMLLVSDVHVSLQCVREAA